ncbi:putative translation elongation factor EFTs/EF1B [Medicago truncatula]|uniref:Elongation factor Ts, mitochondrial n=1 Tax=Medicago truncatula TaxID=3880 RepID=A0A396HI92_MEDTR|nr:putative translation elongation factor EFTs/EF1B [Medicago truncatula]
MYATCVGVGCGQKFGEKKWKCLMQVVNCLMLCYKQSTVVVSDSLDKQLREETGAGMMDCKKAHAETEGDLEKVKAYLRKKGLSFADKKSRRLAAEGRIGTYIHDSCIGKIQGVQFVSIEDILKTIVAKEKELKMQREDLALKPENIREKIVEGRISKRLGGLSLIEQPFIKDDSVSLKDLERQSIAVRLLI